MYIYMSMWQPAPLPFTLLLQKHQTPTAREISDISGHLSDLRALAPKFHGHFGLFKSFQPSNCGFVANTFQFHCHRQRIPEALETLEVSNSLPEMSGRIGRSI